MQNEKFENLYEHPPLVTSVINPRSADSIRTIKRAIAKGTDEFIFQLERLNPKEKTRENLDEMFSCAKGFPIMVTNYVLLIICPWLPKYRWRTVLVG